MGFKPLVRGNDLTPSREEVGTFKRGIGARELGGFLGTLLRMLKKKKRKSEEILAEADKLADDLVIEDEPS